MLLVGVAAGRDRRRAEPDERRRVRHRAHDGPARAPSASSVAIVTPAAIESTSVSRCAATTPPPAGSPRRRRASPRRSRRRRRRRPTPGSARRAPSGTRRSSSRRRSASTSATASSSASQPPSSSPPSSAEPIFPPPISATLRHLARVTPAPSRGRRERVGPEEPSEPPRTSPNGAAPPAPRARQLRPPCDGKGDGSTAGSRHYKTSETSLQIFMIESVRTGGTRCRSPPGTSARRARRARR